MLSLTGSKLIVNPDDNVDQADWYMIRSASGASYVVYEPPTGANAAPASIKIRAIDTSGSPTGPEISLGVPALGTGQVYDVYRVLALADGRFAFVWDEYNQTTFDPASIAVRYQMYSSAGLPIGSVQTVATGNAAMEPSLTDAAVSPSGGFDLSILNLSTGGPSTTRATALVSVDSNGLPGATAPASVADATILFDQTGGRALVSFLATSTGGLIVDFAGPSAPVRFDLTPYLAQPFGFAELLGVVLQSPTEALAAIETPSGIAAIRLIDGQPAALVEVVAPPANRTIIDGIALSNGTFAAVLAGPSTPGVGSVIEIQVYSPSGARVGLRSP